MKNIHPAPVPLRTVEQSEQRQADATAIVSSAIDRRPPDVGEAHWRTALIGLRTFVASGQADEALRLGWPPTGFTLSRRCGLASTCAALGC